MHSMGHSFPSKRERESCTKWSFWVETPVMVWFLVVIALLDGVAAALGHKKLAPLRFKVLLTFLSRLSS